MREKLKAQECLATVVELVPAALWTRVVASIIDFTPVEADAIFAAMTDPRIRIVSLTVTEGGYYLDAATGELAVGTPDIGAYAANPQAPKTVFLAKSSRRLLPGAPFRPEACRLDRNRSGVPEQDS